MLQGDAIGGGLFIALACDLRLAAPHARFGIPVARTKIIRRWRRNMDVVDDAAYVDTLTTLSEGSVRRNFNPYTDIVLNPAAWEPVAANQTGPAPSTLYSDFRGPRRPQENLNVGRIFRIKERYSFQIRGEFVNVFNRTLLPNPNTAELNVK